MEFQFRAWSKNNEEMIYQNIKSSNFGYGSLTASAILLQFDHEFIMQYSGMQDKFKNKIYDKDILKLLDAAGNEINVICKYGKHERKMYSGFLVEIYGFAFISPLGKPTFPIIHNCAGKSDLDIMEVVGNVYETPELNVW